MHGRGPLLVFLGALRRRLVLPGLVSFALLAAGPAHAAPGDVDAAWRAWEAGDLELALEASERAVVGGDAYAWKLRGFLLSTAGRKEEAEAAYARSLQLAPDDAVAHNNHGVVLLDLGRVDEAEEAFRRALDLRADYPDAQNNLGVVLETRGRLAPAEEAYRRAVEQDPDHARAHNNLGAVALRQGRVEEAQASLERAASLDPTLGVPALNLVVLGARDASDDALFQALQQAAARPGAPPSLRARALMAQGARAAAARRFEEAHAHYLAALDLTPNDPALLNNIAVVEDQLGLDREAILHLEAALQLRPGMRVARNNIGIVHVHRGNLELAKGVFQGILLEDAAFHRAHYNLGVILAAEGDLEGARRRFREAARLAPRDAEVRYNLGVLQRQLGGDVASEIRAYERAIDLDDELPEAYLSLGCLLADPQTPAALRDEARAETLLLRYLEIAPAYDEEGIAQARDWLGWLAAR